MVWFGDYQLNTIHSTDTWGGRQPGLGPLVRDLAVAAASLIITAVSFFKFEIPVMRRGAAWRPSTVIAIGFTAMAACAGLALLTTSPSGDATVVAVSKSETQRSTAFNKATKRNAEVVGLTTGRRTPHAPRAPLRFRPATTRFTCDDWLLYTKGTFRNMRN